MGQTSSDNKTGNDSGRKDGYRWSSTCSPLPVEIIGVIAEHLTGQFAFGTVASLNIASKSVYDETLPILYETLLLENFDTLPIYRQRDSLPAGLQYTKFAVLYKGKQRKGQSAEAFKRLVGSLRKVVMIVMLDDDMHTEEANLCTLTVRRPVYSSTAYRILETPVRHPLRQHEVCEVGVALMAGMFEQFGLAAKGTSSGFARQAMRAPISNKRAPMVYGCAEERAKPTIRPVEGIRQVHFMKSARIEPDSSIIKPRSFSLNDANVVFAQGHQRGPEHVAYSIVEIMKFAGIQDSEQHSRLEAEAIQRYRVRDRSLSASVCMYALSYFPWHVQVKMDFRSLSAFAKSLGTAAVSCPGILRSRLHIKMIGDTSQEELSGVLCELLEIYQQHVKLASKLLPWYQGDPQYMLMIEAKQCSTNRAAKGSASPVRRSWMGLIEVKEGRRQRAEFAIKTDPNPTINDMSATGLNQLHDFLSF